MGTADRGGVAGRYAAAGDPAVEHNCQTLGVFDLGIVIEMNIHGEPVSISGNSSTRGAHSVSRSAGTVSGSAAVFRTRWRVFFAHNAIESVFLKQYNWGMMVFSSSGLGGLKAAPLVA